MFSTQRDGVLKEKTDTKGVRIGGAVSKKKADTQAIIGDYIRTAEPVGSKALTEGHELPFSSATIRNEMSELEEMGYLEKPHTSAGRIPSPQATACTSTS